MNCFTMHILVSIFCAKDYSNVSRDYIAVTELNWTLNPVHAA